MFTFALWDKNSRTLFCARDHFGIKPLYYYIAPETGTLLFGSEIKCFLDHPEFKKELNADQLELYLSYQYSPGEDTFFKGVKKLLPATGWSGRTASGGWPLLAAGFCPRPRAFPFRMGGRHQRRDGGERGRPQDCRRGGGAASFPPAWTPAIWPRWPMWTRPSRWALPTSSTTRPTTPGSFPKRSASKFCLPHHAGGILGKHRQYPVPYDEPLADAASAALYFVTGRPPGRSRSACPAKAPTSFSAATTSTRSLLPSAGTTSCPCGCAGPSARRPSACRRYTGSTFWCGAAARWRNATSATPT